MSAVVTIIGPVFGLIALGWLAGRTGYLGESAAKGLPDFIFRLAMPIMLFRTIGGAQLPAVAPGAVLASFFGAATVAWLVATVANAWPLRRPARDGAGIAMGATFSNSVNIGIPIALAHFGEAAAPILALIVLCDTGALWLAATVHYAVTEHGARVSLPRLVGNLALRLATNPIILGCLAGLAWQLLGWTLPPVLDRMVAMLAAAAIPGALVAMGLALNGYALGGQVPSVIAITAIKLAVQPAVAFLLAAYVFGLPPHATGVVTLLAAMPVGANAYLFAASYDRAPAAVSGAIALSTPLAMLTLSALLIGLRGGAP
jgi:hypothetical protein